jgi:hypothetical protein
MSGNYVNKRQSLKLLGEILLDRTNFNVMTRYIANESNLKMMMNLLRDKSKNIQFEAFHVFKVCLDTYHAARATTPHERLYRSLWLTLRNPLRLRQYYGGTGTNC